MYSYAFISYMYSYIVIRLELDIFLLKSREVTSQNSTYSKQIPANFDFLCTRRRQIDSRRGVPIFISIQ